MRLAFWKKKNNTEKKKKSIVREWVDAAVFAIIAATLIRTFFIEAYTIPTGSMEGSLLVNDYLFVSKISYGARIPMTPVAVPLVHNSLFGMKSYTEAVQWNYHRLPGFGHVERYDVVVFNYPGGDTVLKEVPEADYYSALRNKPYNGDRDAIKREYTVMTRPVDKKENYIKRCMGLPGDKLEIRDRVVYVNDQPAKTYPHQQYTYQVTTKGFGISDEFLEENDIDTDPYGNLFLENDQVDMVKNLSGVVAVTPLYYPKGLAEPEVFPQDSAHYKWNRDNYGPFTIPKAGVTVSLTPENIALYRRVIRNYEGNTLEEKDNKIFINGKEVSSYTFKMDYYWMMGDNRHNSLDSRYWGFVPIDHIVGKAWFVWLSYGKRGMLKDMHWKRLLHSVHSLEK